MSNPFIRDISEYHRNLDVINEAINDSAYYLHIQTRKPFDQCRTFVEKNVSETGRFPIKPINIRMTKRKPNGDRIPYQMDIDKLLKGVIASNSIMSPNMVVYDNPTKNKSFHSKSIDDRMAARSIIKKTAAQAKIDGNTSLMTFCDNQQVVIKTLNNSLSGAHASPHNPHYLKTAHSSLTSATRITTSYSNASAERLLIGNRHYFSFDVTIQNIISICKNTDYQKLSTIVSKYSLLIPDAEELFSIINRSSKKYWIDPIKSERVKELIEKLNPLERAAVAFTGDLYHLAKYNPELVRHWITQIVTPISDNETLCIEPDKYVKNANGDIVALCGFICKDLLAGTKVEILKEKNYNGYIKYAATLKHVEDTFNKYSDLIDTLFRTDNLPPSIYDFPTSLRNIVAGSDTDSTMYTCQDWVEWYCGKLEFTQIAQCVSATIMYINTQVTAHLLASISRQMGVEDRSLYRLKMKNEFSFLVYMVANRTKHYTTLINAKEGNIYKKPELEIKGVALKDSKMPPEIMNTLEYLFEDLMKQITEGKRISLYSITHRVANIEHEIIKSIRQGDTKYYSRAYIKSKNSYKLPMVSNYAHYDFWENCFSCKYGEVSKPPIQSIKISNTIDTPRKFTTWVESLDPIIGDKIKEWQLANNKKYLGQFILPVDVVRNGIPKEFISVIDVRGIIKELMQGFYILLEMLGIYMRNDGVTRLLSDDLIYRPEYGSFIVKEKK